MKKIKFLLILCLSIFMITACGSENKESSQVTEKTEKNESSGELTKITVAQPTNGILWGPIHLAKELNYFEDEGLDVEFVTVQGDAPTAPVLSGDAQFGLFGPEMILSFNEKGQGTKLLYTATQKFPYSFLSAKEYNSVEELKGKQINGADSGSSPRQFVRAVLKSANLNPDTDASYANVPNSGIIAALENGDLAATYASPESRQPLLDSGANMLIDMYKPDVHESILGSKNYEMYITYATDKYIEENPEIVQKYINAIYKATLWANEHSAEELTEALQPAYEENNNLASIIKEIKDNDIYSPNGEFTEDGFAAINRMAKEAGLIENDVEYSNVIDDSFLKKAQSKIK